MKRFSIYLFISSFLLFGALLTAGETHHHHQANVIKVDKDGNKIALCGCGMEVKVTESTAKVVDGDDVYYVCSDGCKNYVSEHLSEVKGDLSVKVAKARAEAGTLGNVYAVSESGEKHAVCGCGMDITVSDKTISRTHNGETFYLCSDGCAAQFDKHPDKVSKMAKENAKKKTKSKK